MVLFCRLFDPDEIAEIKRTKLHDVIRKAFAYLPDATNMFTQVNGKWHGIITLKQLLNG